MTETVIEWKTVRCPRCGEDWRVGCAVEETADETPTMHYCRYRMGRDGWQAAHDRG